MQDIAVIEESIELLATSGRLASSAELPGDDGRSLSVAQAKAVALLYHNGELTIGEIAAGLGIRMPAASELIDRLEERGLVSRSVDPADRRRTIIELTDEALDVAVRMHDLRRNQIRAALDQLDPGERPVFLKSMRALAGALAGSQTRSGEDGDTGA